MEGTEGNKPLDVPRSSGTGLIGLAAVLCTAALAAFLLGDADYAAVQEYWNTVLPPPEPLKTSIPWVGVFWVYFPLGFMVAAALIPRKSVARDNMIGMWLLGVADALTMLLILWAAGSLNGRSWPGRTLQHALLWWLVALAFGIATAVVGHAYSRIRLKSLAQPEEKE